MDEGKIIEFYSGNETFVFWNMDDYPVPEDTNLGSIRSNIEHALHIMGFEGHKSINVDCKQLKSNEEELFKANRFVHLPRWTQAGRIYGGARPATLDMTIYILLSVEDTAQEHANVAVIVKPNSDPKNELHRVLNCLKSRGHKVLLVELPPDEECLFSVDSLVNSSQILGGGKPRAKKQLTRADWESDGWEEEKDGTDDVSNLSNNMMMLDFSEPIRHVRGDRTVIFWDAIDSPFPLCFSPDQIFEKIKSAVLEKDLSDNITIWAYVDESSWRDKYTGDNTWYSRIYFLPEGGDRRVRMLNDMYLASRDSPLRYCLGTLILVSDHFKGDPFYMELFERMKYRKYNPVLLIPSEHSDISESPDEWPQSLFARKSSEGPLPKKPKLDDA